MDRGKAASVDVEGVVALHAAMGEGIATARRGHDLDPVRGAQLQGAGQVVVVDVRLQDVGQAPAPFGVGFAAAAGGLRVELLPQLIQLTLQFERIPICARSFDGFRR